MRASHAAARGSLAILVASCLFWLSGPVAAQPGGAPAATPPKPAGPVAATPAPATQPTAPGEGDAEAGDTGAADATGVPGAPEATPVNLRLRSLEQRVQALKERAWRAKARVGMLKEAVLGGGVGASCSVTLKNKMGGAYRLIKIVIALDGAQIFARSDDTGALHDTKTFDVLSGPIAPGSHKLSVLLVYRGHGYGVFKYLTKYKFTVKSSHSFTVGEGKSTAIEIDGFEKGGPTTPLEKRPAVDFKVTLTKGGAS